MVRYPQGPGTPLYLKTAPTTIPDWITLADGPYGGKGGTKPYIVVDTLATLVWAVNFGVVEFHTPMTLSTRIDQPTHLVFDFDPGPGASIVECCRVALTLAGLIDLPLEGAVYKTSGSKGLHLTIPNVHNWTIAEALAWSEDVARSTAADRTLLATADNQRSHRAGKVLIDWQQNQYHKTTAVAHTLRLVSQLGVSTVVSVDEVEQCAHGRTSLWFTPDEVCERLGIR